MATRTKKKVGQDRFLELVSFFPLRPIRSEIELNAALEMIAYLTDREALNLEERDYLDVLGDLVEKYESEVWPMDPVSDAVLLQHLIEAKEVTQAELAKATEIAESTISEVLAGKRSLNRAHISKLCRYFHIGPSAFRLV